MTSSAGSNLAYKQSKTFVRDQEGFLNVKLIKHGATMFSTQWLLLNVAATLCYVSVCP